MSVEMNVPDGWAIKQLYEVGQCKNGLTYSPSDLTNEKGILVLRSSNIQDSKLSFGDNVFVRENIRLNYRVKEGDILICVRNGSKNLIGKNTLITKEAEGMAHGAFMTIFHSKEYNYIFQLFQSDMFFQQVEKNLGATINSINNSDLSLFEFPFPDDIQEQQRIAKILSTLDLAIEASQKLIAKEKNIKKGLMHDLLTNGIDKNGKIRNPKTHNYKESELGLIPEEWEVTILENLCEVIGGGTPKRDDEENWLHGTIPWATPTDITAHKISNYIETTKEKISEYGLKNSSSKLLPADSILLTSRATIGARKINSIPMCTNQGFTSLVPKSENMKYIFYMLSIYEKYMFSRAYGTTFPEISRTEVKNVPVALPVDEAEQTQISTILTTQDKKIQTEEENLSKLKELKKGLMNDLLSGKVRV